MAATISARTAAARTEVESLARLTARLPRDEVRASGALARIAKLKGELAEIEAILFARERDLLAGN